MPIGNANEFFSLFEFEIKSNVDMHVLTPSPANSFKFVNSGILIVYQTETDWSATVSSMNLLNTMLVRPRHWCNYYYRTVYSPYQYFLNICSAFFQSSVLSFVCCVYTSTKFFFALHIKQQCTFKYQWAIGNSNIKSNAKKQNYWTFAKCIFSLNNSWISTHKNSEWLRLRGMAFFTMLFRNSITTAASHPFDTVHQSIPNCSSFMNVCDNHYWWLERYDEAVEVKICLKMVSFVFWSTINFIYCIWRCGWLWACAIG